MGFGWARVSPGGYGEEMDGPAGLVAGRLGRLAKLARGGSLSINLLISFLFLFSLSIFFSILFF